MAVYVNLQNERTGELKAIKVGWSWTLLFFTQFFGIPLFIRRLNQWAVIVLTMHLVTIYMTSRLEDTQDTEYAFSAIILSIFILALSFFFALKGNEMTAKHLLENGWVFANQDDTMTHFAKNKWNVI